MCSFKKKKSLYNSCPEKVDLWGWIITNTVWSSVWSCISFYLWVNSVKSSKPQSVQGLCQSQTEFQMKDQECLQYEWKRCCKSRNEKNRLLLQRSLLAACERVKPTRGKMKLTKQCRKVAATRSVHAKLRTIKSTPPPAKRVGSPLWSPRPAPIGLRRWEERKGHHRAMAQGSPAPTWKKEGANPSVWKHPPWITRMGWLNFSLEACIAVHGAETGFLSDASLPSKFVLGPSVVFPTIRILIIQTALWSK